MSKILVTGGFGYLGGRIVSYLSGKGHKVAIGTRNKERLSEPNTVLTDFENQALLTAKFNDFDTIVHLAGMNEIEAAKNPEAALYTTATYTLRAVQAAKLAGISRFIYFSTVHVYGSPLSGVIKENSPTRASHPYSISHRAAEDFVFQAHREGSLNGTIFRLSNGYGFPESPTVNRWTLLVNDLCRQVALTGQITLKSSGLQYRDFIPLADVCSAVNHFITAPCQDNPIFNLGSGQSITVLDVANLIAERYKVVTGNKAVMNIPKAKVNENPLSFNLSVEKLKSAGVSTHSILNSEIDELIKRCIQWDSEGNFDKN